MSTQVSLAYHLCRDKSIRLIRDVCDAIGSALEIDCFHLVDVLAALESEVLVSLKLRTFGQDRDIELAGLMDHVVREIQLVDRNAYSVWFGRNLRYRVNDTAVILGAVFCRQNKESVSQVVHGFAVHSYPPFF